MFNMIF